MSPQQIGPQQGIALATGAISGKVTKVVQVPQFGDIQVISAGTAEVIVFGFYTDEAPSFSGGYGGREPQARPKKVSLTPWAGRQPFTLNVPMLLSNRGDSITDFIRAIHNIGSGNGQTVGPTGKVTADTEPQLLNVQARGLRFPDHAAKTWAIEDVQWGQLWRRADFAPRQQLVTLTFQEQPTGDILTAPTLSATQRGKVRHYTVTKEDLKAHRGLTGIAAKQLGDPNRWVDIAALNHISRSSQLKAGMVLTLP